MTLGTQPKPSMVAETAFQWLQPAAEQFTQSIL